MTMTEAAITEVNSIRVLAGEEAQLIAASNPSIRSIALAGSWALGIPSPMDIDLVLIFDNGPHVKDFFWAHKEIGNGRRLDLHCRTCADFEKRTFTTKSNLKVVKAARKATRLLRHFPGIKKILLLILQHKVSSLTILEIAPQGQQILFPLVDRDGYLQAIQKKQRRMLENELTPCDLLLYQPNGFYLLLEGYLDGHFTRNELRKSLIPLCVDSKEYLKRAIRCYGAESAKKLISLYSSIYGEITTL